MRRGPWGSGKCWQSVQTGAAARSGKRRLGSGAAPFTWGAAGGHSGSPGVRK